MIKFIKFIPVQLTFFLILGILLGRYINFSPIFLLIICCIFLFLLGIAYLLSNRLINGFKVGFSTIFIGCSLIIGIASITFQQQLHQSKHYTNTSFFSDTTQFKAILKVSKVLKATNKFYKYEAKVLQLNNQQVLGKVLLNVSIDSLLKPLYVDAEILTKTEFSEIPKLLNPYGFDYRKYLNNQQIYHQLYINSFLLLPQSSKTIYGAAATFRDKINKTLIQNGFSGNELALINALLLGQRTTISEDLLEDYKDAGAIHILAVSGLHVGIILLFLVFLFKALHTFKYGKVFATVLIINLLWVYAVIAGLSPSVVRAVTMFTALAIGLHINKPSNVYNNLIISMFFLLLFHPFYLFEIGFQLSYIAVFSIVWIQPKLYNIWISKIWIFRKLWQLFTVSIAAQIGVLPLSLFYFHQFPGLFFVANMLIIPFLGFILITGIVVIILSLFSILPSFIAMFYIYVLEIMNAIITWVSSIEIFIIRNISVSLSIMLGVYGVVFFLLKWLEKRTNFRLQVVLVVLIIVQSIAIFEKFHLQNTQEFIVFNSYTNSCYGVRNGKSITVNSVHSNNVLMAYVVGSGITQIKTAPCKNLAVFKKHTILVVDSLGIYSYQSIKPTIVLLQQSPKINLDRLLNQLKPQFIVADATNYTSYIKKWEATCKKNKTPFYYTQQKGAFILRE